MPDSLPTPPLLRRVPQRHWDALAGGCALLYALVAWGPLMHELHDPPLVALGTALAAVPIAIARRWPVAAFTLLLAAVSVSFRGPALAGIALLPSAYVLYISASRSRPRVAIIMLCCGVLVPVALPYFVGRHLASAQPSALFLVTAWTIGYAVGRHRAYTAQVVGYHAGLADAAAERAGRELAEERLRIARELHDIVAHSMALVTVQAGCGRLVVHDKPDQAGAALATIEETGRSALGEMRRMLGVLRAETAELPAPLPGVRELATLVQQTEASGIPVTLAVSGSPRELPPGLDLTAYRVIQEALTNVVKHSGSGSAAVSVDFQPEALVLSVTDRGSGADLSAEPPGHGITGMRERVAMCGGWFHAGSLPEGGFRVAARLPL